MNTSLQYRLAIIVFPLLFLTSCLNDEFDDPLIQGPDPVFYDIFESWKETGKKINDNDWETIANGDTLTLFLNYKDASKKNFVGQYSYDPISLNLELDKTGDVNMGEDHIVFMPVPYTKDSIRLPMQLINNENDTLLIIRNTISEPKIEVKYKRINSRLNPML